MKAYKVWIIMKILANSEQEAIDMAVGEMVEAEDVQNAELLRQAESDEK